MRIEPDKRSWTEALKAAPDAYEVHTIYKRYASGPAGREIWQQRVTGRRIVANGVTLYEEHETDTYA